MIIGLTGYGRSGKDTFAERLVWKHGFTRRAFADGVRELALEANPTIVLGPGSALCVETTLRQCVSEFGWDHVKEHLGGRRFLENLGAGARRVIGQSVWTDAVFRHLDDGVDYVITDVRHPDEAQITGDFGTVIRITRPGEGPKGPMDVLLDHEEFLTISNEGTVTDLWAKADLLVQSLKELECPTSSPSTRRSSTSETTKAKQKTAQTSSPSSKRSISSPRKNGR